MKRWQWGSPCAAGLTSGCPSRIRAACCCWLAGSSSRGGMLWSRLCRGSWGATSDSEFSSFSQDMRSWFTPSASSGVEANGEVACLEDMILLREEQRRHVSHKTLNFQWNNFILNKQSCKCQTGNAGSQLSFCMRALRSHIYELGCCSVPPRHIKPHDWTGIRAGAILSMALSSVREKRHTLGSLLILCLM